MTGAPDQTIDPVRAPNILATDDNTLKVIPKRSSVWAMSERPAPLDVGGITLWRPCYYSSSVRLTTNTWIMQTPVKMSGIRPASHYISN